MENLYLRKAYLNHVLNNVGLHLEYYKYSADDTGEHITRISAFSAQYFGHSCLSFQSAGFVPIPKSLKRQILVNHEASMTREGDSTTSVNETHTPTAMFKCRK